MTYRETVARGPRVDEVKTSDGTFHLKVLSGAERSTLEKEWGPLEGDDFTAILIARTLCDPSGKREFEGVDTATAIAEVLSGPSPANIALAKKAWELNLLGQAGVESEKNG